MRGNNVGGDSQEKIREEILRYLSKVLQVVLNRDVAEAQDAF